MTVFYAARTILRSLHDTSVSQSPLQFQLAIMNAKSSGVCMRPYRFEQTYLGSSCEHCADTASIPAPCHLASTVGGVSPPKAQLTSLLSAALGPSTFLLRWVLRHRISRLQPFVCICYPSSLSHSLLTLFIRVVTPCRTRPRRQVCPELKLICTAMSHTWHHTHQVNA